MPDLEVIQKKVSEEWKMIGKHLKGMDEYTHDAVIQVFVDNWDLVNEVHTFYSRLTELSDQTGEPPFELYTRLVTF